MSNAAAALLLGMLLGAGAVVFGEWLGRPRQIRKTATHRPAGFKSGGYMAGRHGPNFNPSPDYPRPPSPPAPPWRL